MRERSYFICTTPRSGSYLLADALQVTGALGCPQEYVRADYERSFLDEWTEPRRPTYADYVESVVDTAATPNGVVGIKFHWEPFEQLINALSLLDGNDLLTPPEIVAHHFGQVDYVFLVRLDKLGQAISYQRAFRTGRWWWDDPAPPAETATDAFPDLVYLDQLKELLEHQERCWRCYFRRSGISPLTITYEDLAEDPVRAVASIAEYLGVSRTEFLAEPATTLRRQADGRSVEWRHAYLTRMRASRDAVGAGDKNWSAAA